MFEGGNDMLLSSAGKPMNRHSGVWRALLSVAAILALSASLGTRTFHVTIPHSVSVQSDSTAAVHQNMDGDAFQWVAPVLVFSVLPAPSFYPRVAPAGPPLPSLNFDETLYNRPPPSC